MFIQGNLQKVFDALFAMGVINPVLSMDWAPADKAKKQSSRKMAEVIHTVNETQGEVPELIQNLRKFDQESLQFLAMEVARELVDFEDRKVVH